MKSPSTFVVTLMLALACGGAWTGTTAQAAAPPCVGDCNLNHRVTVDELITGVNIALDAQPVARCRALDPGGDDRVTIDELVAAVNATLAGCGPGANRPPRADDISFVGDSTEPYLEHQLVGTDPDGDTITYELAGDDSGTGYSFAYLNPHSGMLYVTLTPDFEGTIVLPYRVTDGKLFGNTAHTTIQVQRGIASNNGGVVPVAPAEYARYPRGYYHGALQGAPGLDPWLPSSVDLSGNFPLAGAQGNQNSCVGWALGYALKTYQERLEIGWSLEPLAHRFSPSYIYNQVNGGQDLGSRYIDALTLVTNQGVATLARMPYDENDFLTQPSAWAHQEAAQFKMLRWDTANGILEIKDALANHYGVMLILHQFDDLAYLRGPSSVYNTFNGVWRAQHAVTAVGYDDARYGGALRVLNSWGQNWGDAGYFWLPYSAANQAVWTPDGWSSVLIGAVVLHDMANPNDPLPDPVDPKAGDRPNLQVTNWSASFNGTPGGSGALQYTVTNTGITTAPAGGFVALLVSRDPAFKSGNTLVVYEPIPFDMAPGTTVYRDAHNTIAFNFPANLEPGPYYMALWADIWDGVDEAYENDNISAATAPIDIVNTLADMQVVTWYSYWDELGWGQLTYEVINHGASTAPTGWLVTLALSPNDIIGDGDETFLFAEPANFALDPGGTLYRDAGSAASFSLYFDYHGNAVPDGVYHIALWLDPNGFLAESNEYNNASMSWGTIRIGLGDGGALGAAAADATSTAVGEAYNGKTLPQSPPSVRRVRIASTPNGRRRMERLDEPALAVSRADDAAAPRWTKVARARQQVIFPVGEMKPMPAR